MPVAVTSEVAGGATAASAFSARREARLRPEHAEHYPGVTVGRWECAATLADRVLAGRLLRGRPLVLGQRVLLEGHFEFRGGHEPRQAGGPVRPRREDR